MAEVAYNKEDISSSGNDNNKFVNLSSFALVQIVKHLDDVFDKIFLTLSCKKFYNNRNVLIPTLVVKDSHVAELGSCFLNSYKSIFQRSVPTSDEVSMSIGAIREYYPDKYFHSVGPLSAMDDVAKALLTLEIPQDVTKLRLGIWNHSNDLVKQMIERCPNINSLEFTKDYFGEVQPGTIPRQIKSLSNLNNVTFKVFPIPLLQGIFQEGLETLEISMPNSTQHYDIGPGVLPSTLKKLTYKGLSFRIDQFPPQLEELRLMWIGSIGTIDIKSFPTSLTTIQITSRWISKLKGLPLLNKIIFETESDFHLQLGDIPSSVTHIDFLDNKYLVPAGLIPPTVKHLNMGEAKYYLSGAEGLVRTTFFTEAHQFDYLNLGKGLVHRHLLIQPGEIPSVRHLVIYNDQDSHRNYLNKVLQLKSGSIPLGVEILEIGLPTQYLKNLIPNTVKVLTYTLDKLDYKKRILKPDEIPSSVSTLKFDRYRREIIPEQSIPKSVTTVCFSNVYGQMNSSWHYMQLPATVTSINVESNSGDTYFLRKIDDGGNNFILIKHTHINYILRSGFIRFSEIDSFANLELMPK